MSAQKTHQWEVNLRGPWHMKAEQMRSLAADSNTQKTRPVHKRSAGCFPGRFRTGEALPASGDQLSLIRSRLVIIKDDLLNQLRPWDSLCSQQWVMSVPRALKLTLIIAPKTITKQQELADVSGGCVVTVDGVMFTWRDEMKSKRVVIHTCTTLLLFHLRITRFQGLW